MKFSQTYRIYKFLKAVWDFINEWWPVILIVTLIIMFVKIDKILK